MDHCLILLRKSHEKDILHLLQTILNLLFYRFEVLLHYFEPIQQQSVYRRIKTLLYWICLPQKDLLIQYGTLKMVFLKIESIPQKLESTPLVLRMLLVFGIFEDINDTEFLWLLKFYHPYQQLGILACNIYYMKKATRSI